MSQFTLKGSLLASTVIAGVAVASPAYAQDASNQPTAPVTTAPGSPVPGSQTSEPTETTGAPEPGQKNPTPSQNTNAPDDYGDEIVVTGSLFPRRTTSETPSPVTVMSSESLAQRGLNTAAEAIQRVTANNAGTIQSGWNTGFNFASGANAPALRGLTVQSTLSIFDGLRMAPYPLADDGQRNFVDLNTIPNAIIDRIEVLRDGASSTYGADAIAGVINVITKKEIQGLHLNGSFGISQRGDGGEQRFDATYGYGDLDSQGFNFYVGAEYQHQNELWARDRGFPFNTQDLSSICNDAGSCMANLNWNGISESGAFNGLISIPGVTLVRPGGTAGANTGSGRFQFLNPSAGCRGYDVVQAPTSTTAPLIGTVPSACEVDFQRDYIQLAPDIKRMGLSARTTVNVGEDHQIYAMGNIYRTQTAAEFTPLGFNGTPTPPIPSSLGAYNVMLPVYVCPTGTGTRIGTNTGCTAANGVLNPYNPFAASGQTAQAFVRSTRPRTVETSARALRGTLGASGTVLGFNYNADITASSVRLKRTQGNYLIPQRIADAVARGLINFNDLEATPDDVWDFIGPKNKVTSTTNLWQATGTLSRSLFALPGGDLGVAVGLQYRHESVDAPSANPALNDQNGLPDPTQNQYLRYYSINSVSAKGSRDVKSAFFEVQAPIVTQFEVNLSGRYDKYSTGQSNFSPKIGAKFTPVREVAIRGTYSKGFRIPSFNEAFGLPTTGYVTQDFSATCDGFAAFCAAHGNNAYATGPFPLGLTQTGNPALKPEKSTSFTAGIIFEPIRNVSFNVDFWNIKVKDLITGVTDVSPVVDAYYANNGVVNIPGYTVIPGAPDPAFPNALPHIGFIQSPYRNAAQQQVRGVDFGANAKIPLTGGITLNSYADASYLMKYILTDENGNALSYAGTLSPCNITSCSGAPRWRAQWQNTLDFGGRTSLSATVYYTSGYDQASIDFGGVKGDCLASAGNSTPTYEDGSPVSCRSKAVWNVDLVGSHKVNDKLTVYANVLNPLDTKPPFDHAAAYGLFNFNPAWAGPNIMGRYFRLGAKVDF